MTKTEIIAELRRSAAEDERPTRTLKHDAWLMAINWKRGVEEVFSSTSPEEQRAFCLLVAHAMEDE